VTDNTTLTRRLTENLVYEITKALALPQTQGIRKIIALLTGKAIRQFTEIASELDCVVEKEGLVTWFRKARPDRQRLAFMVQMIRQMIAGKELFGLTPRVTFGDLISAETTRDREHMLQTIT
jgi:hypothetical protein